MGKFKELEIEIEEIKKESESKKDLIRSRAKKIMELNLKKRTDLTEYIGRLEQSKNLTSDGEWPCRWTRMDAAQFIDTESELEKSLFEEYLQDNFFVSIDYKHDSIFMSDGPCILINEDGDVLDQDSGKWIIDKKDYESGPELKKLIEEYMEKSEYFPSVVRCDHYGNMFYVNTQGWKNEKSK
tara:strand:+ start:513 stop:1061 length:549 start_codon:yes stop_codon:yes gene_type:complete